MCVQPEVWRHRQPDGLSTDIFSDLDSFSFVFAVLQGGAPKSFTFDSCFGVDSKQVDVYNETARPIVDSALEGFNGTIFAYGQTGTGKSAFACVCVCVCACVHLRVSLRSIRVHV